MTGGSSQRWLPLVRQHYGLSSQRRSSLFLILKQLRLSDVIIARLSESIMKFVANYSNNRNNYRFVVAALLTLNIYSLYSHPNYKAYTERHDWYCDEWGKEPSAALWIIRPIIANYINHTLNSSINVRLVREKNVIWSWWLADFFLPFECSIQSSKNEVVTFIF